MVVDQWTGKHACALQAALRLTQDEFASQLGVARRTVAAWHERPEVILRTELQRVLDTSYERATEAVRERFARQLDSQQPTASTGATVALAIAIAVVVRDSSVLLVCRRDSGPSGITWQFPAGIVKPGAAPNTTAVREVLAETAVHCAVREYLGERIHPLSGVDCHYFLCDYLAGEAENRDGDENVSTLWVVTTEVTRFIPADTIFAPVLRALEAVS
jgi:8-oxo-dGTP pyrophosphatase MutT (NUDIX family)/DNA-binding XRE family transcriptional regulator